MERQDNETNPLEDQAASTHPAEELHAVSSPVADPLSQENPFKPAYQRMQSDIRVWGWSSSILGVLHFIVSGFLNPAWGIALFVVGGISFLIREASMFIVYAVIMGWVGVSNVVSGSFGSWTLFGALQVYWSYKLYRKYQDYQTVEKNYLDFEKEPEKPANRARDSFPGCGCAMGTIGLLAAVGVFFLMIVVAVAQEPDAPLPENFELVEFILGALLASGILGFALSVAALVAGYKRKWLAWGGVVTGGLLMAFEIFLRFMPA